MAYVPRKERMSLGWWEGEAGIVLIGFWSFLFGVEGDFPNSASSGWSAGSRVCTVTALLSGSVLLREGSAFSGITEGKGPAWIMPVPC